MADPRSSLAENDTPGRLASGTIYNLSTPPPQLSPDGRFYWDGEKWVPMPASAQGPIEVRGKVRVHAATWRYWFWGIVFAVIMVIVIASFCTQR